MVLGKGWGITTGVFPWLVVFELPVDFLQAAHIPAIISNTKAAYSDLDLISKISILTTLLKKQPFHIERAAFYY
jgi:hypothetical protein